MKKEHPTLSSFMSPSNCTISSLRVSCSADILISNSSLRWRRTRSSVNRLGSHPICWAFLTASSCSCFSLRISFKRDLKMKDNIQRLATYPPTSVIQNRKYLEAGMKKWYQSHPWTRIKHTENQGFDRCCKGTEKWYFMPVFLFEVG